MPLALKLVHRPAETVQARARSVSRDRPSNPGVTEMYRHSLTALLAVALAAPLPARADGNATKDEAVK
jgi:hypothetical protein